MTAKKSGNKKYWVHKVKTVSTFPPEGTFNKDAKTVARIMARCLNCEQGPTPTPCGKCASCLEIAGGSGVDVIEIDAASNRGINEMRELRENVRYRPARDRYKVFIVDEAHQITSEAFNALLKTLEEPPDWVVFVLCTTEAHKIPTTIAGTPLSTSSASATRNATRRGANSFR